MEGQLAGVPLNYTRTYRFGAEEITVDLEISASAEVTLDALEEILPLTQESDFAIHAITKQTLEVEATPVNQTARLSLKAPGEQAAHYLQLDPPRTLRREAAEGFPHGVKEPTPLRPLALALPTVWKAGDQKRFSMTFSFAPSVQGSASIRD